MRKLTVTILSTALLAGGVGATSALAANAPAVRHHAEAVSTTDRASRQGHRERSTLERSHRADRAPGDREAGRSR